MTTVHQSEAGSFACSKGAAEIVLEGCRVVRTNGGEELLDRAGKARIVADAEAMAAGGVRVLGVARKEPADPETAEIDMTFLGRPGRHRRSFSSRGSGLGGDGSASGNRRRHDHGRPPGNRGGHCS